MSNNNYPTSDIGLSAYLATRGHEIAEVRRNGQRATFVFRETDGLQSDISGWLNNAPTSIRPRLLINTLRDLKSMSAS
jgi:hypothetical protein